MKTNTQTRPTRTALTAAQEHLIHRALFMAAERFEEHASTVASIEGDILGRAKGPIELTFKAQALEARELAEILMRAGWVEVVSEGE